MSVAQGIYMQYNWFDACCTRNLHAIQLVRCLLHKEFICNTTGSIQHYKFQASKVDQMIRSGTFQVSFSEILGYPAI